MQRQVTYPAPTGRSVPRQLGHQLRWKMKSPNVYSAEHKTVQQGIVLWPLGVSSAASQVLACPMPTHLGLGDSRMKRKSWCSASAILQSPRTSVFNTVLGQIQSHSTIQAAKRRDSSVSRSLREKAGRSLGLVSYPACSLGALCCSLQGGFETFTPYTFKLGLMQRHSTSP